MTELRQTIELLRKQSIQAGLTTAHMQSMGIRADGVNVTGQVRKTLNLLLIYRPFVSQADSRARFSYAASRILNVYISSVQFVVQYIYF